MDKQTLEEIINCLPRERTLFRYFRGRFACLLLAAVAEKIRTVAELKNSRFARLAQRPEVKDVLSRHGGGDLNSDQLSWAWREPGFCFVLGLARWGGKRSLYKQVSRNGMNLVLQLNFSNEHNSAYRKLYRPSEDNVFNYYGHPAAFAHRSKRAAETLAWARIDLDFDTNEALIEEIQSDWIRLAGRELKYIRACQKHNKIAEDYLSSGSAAARLRYFCEVLAPYENVWSEAMLAACVWFITTELGIKQIYMHTAQSGGAVKRITGDQPPRSLYHDLPRKFCFERSPNAPEFLTATKAYRRLAKKVPIRWHYLSL